MAQARRDVAPLMNAPPVLSSAPLLVGQLDGKRILVVEDDDALRQILVHALSKQYAVYEATDGLAAIQLVRQIAPPDLVVCDVMMPNIDGFGFAHRMRERRDLERVPLIFLTAKTDVSSIVEGINSGARHYLPKPFKVVDLLERVAKILHPDS
jgi:DNA-binding response OmpR family regulator